MLSRGGDLYHVRWDDGVDEEFHLGDYERLVKRGSLEHEALARPEQLRATLESDPTVIFSRLLQASADALTSKQLKQRLVDLGLDGKQVDAGWDAARKAWTAGGRVTAIGKGSAKRYSWSGSAPETSRPAEPAEPSVDDSERQATEASAAERTETVAPEQGQSGAAPPHDLAVQPAGEPVTVPIVSPAAPSLEDLLAAAAEEVRRDVAMTAQQRVATADLVRKGVEVAATLTPRGVASLIEVLAAIAASADREIVESSVAHLADLLPSLSPEARDTVDVDRLALVASGLPLTNGGGRGALLVAVARVWPQRVADEGLWRGIPLADIASAAGGALGAVTSLPLVGEKVIAPLMMRALSQVTTFGRLTALLGMPREILALVPTDAVATAFRRVAADDRMVSGWIQALSASDRSAELEQRLADAQAEIAVEQERTRRVQLRMEELEAHCADLEEVMRAEHTQASEMRSAQDRQIRIDVVRALAGLAAEVEELAAERTEPHVLVDRVRALVAAHDLEPVGSAGQELAFEPKLHDPITGSPGTGTAVTVIRPGYRWRPANDDVLLGKAVVMTT